jgi:hypothetical protein
MINEDAGEVISMPTDPSLEFDLFEVFRLRLAEALTHRGYDTLEAERIALYVVKGVRPVSHFLKVLTREKAPGDDEIVDALTRVLDESPAFGRATRLLLRAEEDEL